MTTVKLVEVSPNQYVYMEVEESVQVDNAFSINLTNPSDEYIDSEIEHRGVREHVQKTMTNLQDVIRSMMDTTAQALNGAALGDVNKITLEFGIKLGGEAGIPFITNGKAEGAVTIKVEFNPRKSEK